MTYSKSILFIDAVAPRGHVSLNRFYISKLLDCNVSLVISEQIAALYDGVGTMHVFSDYFLKKGRALHSLFTLFITLKFLFLNIFKKKSTVVLLSYDITNLFIISHIANIFGVKLIVFEHNTLPGDSNYKKILQKLCSKKTLRFCFTAEAKEEYISLNQDAIMMPHPLINEVDSTENNKELEQVIRKYESVVFCPSASADNSNILTYCKEYPNFLFIVKSKQPIYADNCYTKAFFDEYDWIMRICDFVYLPISFTGRVSGPMFGAVFHSCKVVVDRNSFGEEAHSQFGDMIQYSDEQWLENKVTFNVNLYNNEIVKKYRMYLLG